MKAWRDNQTQSARGHLLCFQDGKNQARPDHGAVQRVPEPKEAIVHFSVCSHLLHFQGIKKKAIYDGGAIHKVFETAETAESSETAKSSSSYSHSQLPVLISGKQERNHQMVEQFAEFLNYRDKIFTFMFTPVVFSVKKKHYLSAHTV